MAPQVRSFFGAAGTALQWVHHYADGAAAPQRCPQKRSQQRRGDDGTGDVLAQTSPRCAAMTSSSARKRASGAKQCIRYNNKKNKTNPTEEGNNLFIVNRCQEKDSEVIMLEMVAPAPSAKQGRSKWMLHPARSYTNHSLTITADFASCYFDY